MVLQYRMLGPLELRTADHVLPLGGRRQQTLLAALLLNTGTTVPFDRLVADLWDDPPRTAHRQVVNAAAAVRRVVEHGGGGAPGATRGGDPPRAPRGRVGRRQHGPAPGGGASPPPPHPIRWRSR